MNSEKYAIELKYPAHRKNISDSVKKKNHGEYPYRMKQFIEDIIFMDKLKKEHFTKTFCIVVVDDNAFHKGNINLSNKIYECFRKQVDGSIREISGIIPTPTKKARNSQIDLSKIAPQKVEWNYIDSDNECAFYVIEFN